jgi:hypothetical protein
VELTLSTATPLPAVPRLLPADLDFFGAVDVPEDAVPGPFADRFAQEVVLDLRPVPRWP